MDGGKACNADVDAVPAASTDTDDDAAAVVVVVVEGEDEILRVPILSGAIKVNLLWCRTMCVR